MAKYKIHFTKGPDIWVKYVDEVTNSNEAVLVCVMENKEPEELLPYYADILSLAVVADVMPLTQENLSIVKYGIHKLKTFT